jgi:hypothetical protein
MEKSTRVLIEVVAGIVPNTIMPEHTKQFAITSDVWYAQGEYEERKEEAQMEAMKIYGVALEYMRSMMNPQRVNWVRLDWIYL